METEEEIKKRIKKKREEGECGYPECDAEAWVYRQGIC
jgi:hypothetical protein